MILGREGRIWPGESWPATKNGYCCCTFACCDSNTPGEDGLLLSARGKMHRCAPPLSANHVAGSLLRAVLAIVIDAWRASPPILLSHTPSPLLGLMRRLCLHSGNGGRKQLAQGLLGEGRSVFQRQWRLSARLRRRPV